MRKVLFFALVLSLASTSMARAVVYKVNKDLELVEAHPGHFGRDFGRSGYSDVAGVVETGVIETAETIREFRRLKAEETINESQMADAQDERSATLEAGAQSHAALRDAAGNTASTSPASSRTGKLQEVADQRPSRQSREVASPRQEKPIAIVHSEIAVPVVVSIDDQEVGEIAPGKSAIIWTNRSSYRQISFQRTYLAKRGPAILTLPYPVNPDKTETLEEVTLPDGNVVRLQSITLREPGIQGGAR